MVQIVRFRTRQRKADQAALLEAAEALRQLGPEALDQLTGYDRLLISKAIHALHRNGSPNTVGGIWPGGFTMLSRDQTHAVWKAFRDLKPHERPHQVREAFMVMMLNLRKDTGEVMLSREEIAKEIGCAPNHVSRIMSTLERMGVVTRDLTRVEGMRGRGIVTYKLNPHVAWNGHLGVRQDEAAKAAPPLLKLMQGGAPGDTD